MGESMLFLVLLAGCVIYGIDRKRRERKGALRRAALWMEQSPAVPADMDAVQDWWRALADGKGGGVDDITWQDLDMDAIFTAMNHTATGVGEEQLHAILRDTQTPEDTLSRRRRWVEALRKDGPRAHAADICAFAVGQGPLLRWGGAAAWNSGGIHPRETLDVWRIGGTALGAGPGRIPVGALLAGRGGCAGRQFVHSFLHG